METTKKIFPKRLKEARLKKGLTQAQAAEKLNTTQGTYQKWEAGKSEPNLETLVKISKLFDTNVDYLLQQSILSVSTEDHFIDYFDFSNLENLPIKQYPEIKVAIVHEYLINHRTTTETLKYLINKYNLSEKQIALLKTIIEDTKRVFLDDF